MTDNKQNTGPIVILRAGKPVEIAEVDPNETLLDYLRLRERATGTKEGCAEGDCGACTVAIGRLIDGKLTYEPVNSCIQLLAMAHGKDVITVDDLANNGELHPVQRAMVDQHASQCGFCTPGIVMSLFALYHSGETTDRANVNDWLAGNLCRCTGYRPIAAAVEAWQGPRSDRFAGAIAKTEEKLRALALGDLLIGDEERFFAAPASLDSLLALADKHRDATIVAGATDVGLWITKQLRDLPKIIHVGRVAGFADIRDEGDTIRIMAGATYRDAEAALGSIDPDVGEIVRRIGSKQVRASGTLGGNIANGSPIGDTPPVLIALGAELELAALCGRRTMVLEKFFIEYGKQDRRPGEIVASVTVPRLAPNQKFRAFKISKRFDQDISALLGAFCFTLEGSHITVARIVFGGMAATPKRAAKAEAAIIGATLDDEKSWQNAITALEDDFSPIADMRASADYRRTVAGNLLAKALNEIAGEQATRVIGEREAS